MSSGWKGPFKEDLGGAGPFDEDMFRTGRLKKDLKVDRFGKGLR